MQDNLREIINILWSKRLPFVAYKLPKKQDVKILVQYSTEIKIFNLENIENISGFVIAPFESAQTKNAYLLEADVIFNAESELQEVEKLQTFDDDIYTNSLVNSICSKEIYLKKANAIINDLKNEHLQKIVLSRVIEKKLKNDFNPGLAFGTLMEQYPNAFNYMFHLPAIGSWMGATPETFLRINDVEAQTVSLAGTKPIEQINWTLKERREQSIVTDFIGYQLDKLGVVNYRIDGPETEIAGNVAHLTSKFTIPKSGLHRKTAQLISSLHPTPAVCGMPKKEAYNYIMQAEGHDRKFYSGFLGPWQVNGQSDLFVNLRCAEFNRFKMHVFVGGGLTAASVAESEWDETVHKSKTLLSVTEKF